MAEEFKIEEALARLEAIAKEQESGDLDLEQSLARYREARELLARCVSRLDEAEREVRTLLADGEIGTLDVEEAGGTDA